MHTKLVFPILDDFTINQSRCRLGDKLVKIFKVSCTPSVRGLNDLG